MNMRSPFNSDQKSGIKLLQEQISLKLAKFVSFSLPHFYKRSTLSSHTNQDSLIDLLSDIFCFFKESSNLNRWIKVMNDLSEWIISCINFNHNLDPIKKNRVWPGISIRGVTRYFYPPKWSLVPSDFKEFCIRFSWELFKF